MPLKIIESWPGGFPSTGRFDPSIAAQGMESRLLHAGACDFEEYAHLRTGTVEPPRVGVGQTFTEKRETRQAEPDDYKARHRGEAVLGLWEERGTLCRVSHGSYVAQVLWNPRAWCNRFSIREFRVLNSTATARDDRCQTRPRQCQRERATAACLCRIRTVVVPEIRRPAEK